MDALTLLGFGPEDASDPTALLVVGAVTEAAAELRVSEMRAQAVHIIAALGEALKK
jgi:hypothetical protein